MIIARLASTQNKACNSNTPCGCPCGCSNRSLAFVPTLAVRHNLSISVDSLAVDNGNRLPVAVSGSLALPFSAVTPRVAGTLAEGSGVLVQVLATTFGELLDGLARLLAAVVSHDRTKRLLVVAVGASTEVLQGVGELAALREFVARNGFISVIRDLRSRSKRLCRELALRLDKRN